jgi:hypothetical protein
MAVEAAETRRRERLVDGREHVHPRIARRNPLGVSSEELREMGVDEAGVARAAAVVDEARDRRDAELAQAREALVRPAPIASVGIVRCNHLPHDRVAQRADPERRDGVEVRDPVEMARLFDLVAEFVADLNDRALKTAPKLKRLLTRHVRPHAGCGDCRDEAAQLGTV